MATREEIEQIVPLIEHQLHLDRECGDPFRLLETLFYLALSYALLGRYQESYTTFQEVLPLARETQDREKEQSALIGCASAMTHQQRYHDALSHWQAALQCARELMDREVMAEALANYGFALSQAQLPEQALPLLYEALDLIRQAENRQSEANTLNTLGTALSQLGRVQEAMETYNVALTLARESGDQSNQAFHLGNIGREYMEALGQPLRAIEYFTEALALFRAIGDRDREVQTLYNLGKVHHLCEQYRQAERVLKQGHWLAGELGDIELRIRVIELLSDVMAKQGRIDDAVEYSLQERRTEDPYQALNRHQEARAHAGERGDKRAEAYHLGEVATALGILDYRADALSANLEAIMLYREGGEQHGEGICFVNIGTHCYFLESFPECLACWSRALELLDGEKTAEEELLRQKLDQVEQQWGGRMFKQYKSASAPFLQQIREQDGNLETLFAPILARAQAKDQEEVSGEEYPLLTSLIEAEAATSQQYSEPSRQRHMPLTRGMFPQLLQGMSLSTISGNPSLAGSSFPSGTGMWDLVQEDLEDEVESNQLILEGRRTLLRKVYSEAQERFEEAMEFDPVGLTSARFWYAMSCLWANELDEAGMIFEEIADEGDVVGEGAVARILAQWSDMCLYPTRQSYWDYLRELHGYESEEELVEWLEPTSIDVLRGGAEGVILAGLQYVIQGEYESCLRMLATVHTTSHICSPWICSFWKAMTESSLGEEEPAITHLHTALMQGMPPVLMGPLRWLKPMNDDPSSWFSRVVSPLFIVHDHLYDEYSALPTRDGARSLPSQAVKIAPIREALPLTTEGPEGRKEEDILELSLSNARGPGGPARLLLVEFDASSGKEHEQLLWPTKFVVCYERESGKLSQLSQEFWIDYTAGRLPVALIDRNFHLMTNTHALSVIGRDFLVGDDSYLGRGGTYWIAEENGLPINTFGTTNRLERLPPGTIAYLQELIDEVFPCMKIYCEACDQQAMQVTGVWCKHIWFCSKCQHISSPIERSRRLVNTSACYCPHRFPKVSQPN